MKTLGTAPQEQSEQRPENQQQLWPALTVADVRSAQLSHALQHAVRHATRVVAEHTQDPSELRAAIIAAVELATGGGLHEVLEELLPSGEEAGQLHWDARSDVPMVDFEAARHALIAAMLYAEQLCVAANTAFRLPGTPRNFASGAHKCVAVL